MRTEDNVLIAGFVISVTYVDAFAVVYIVVIFGCAGEFKITHVLHCGGREVVVYPSVNQVTGSRDLFAVGIHTGHHITETVGTCSARTGEVDNGIDVLKVCNPTKLNCVVAVDKQNDVIEVFVEVRNDFKLGCIGLEIVLSRNTAKCCHITCFVATLTACAREDKHSNGTFKSVYKGSVFGDNAQGALVDRPVEVCTVVHNANASLVGGACATLVEVPKGIVYQKTCVFQAGAEVFGQFKGTGTGTRATADEDNGGVAEDAELGAFLKGKQTVVFQEGNAFLNNLCYLLFFISVELAGTAKIALVIVNV